MSDQNKDQYPADAEHLITDERFVELTGGIEKDQLYPFMVGMRDFGAAGVKVEGEVITIRPGNLENGSLYPQLDIEGDGVRTSLLGFGGKQVSLSVAPLSEDLKGLGEVRGKLDIKGGIRVQDETDFAIIPPSHWKAVGIAISQLPSASKAAEAATDASGKRRGRFLGRIFRNSESPYKN